MATKIPIPVKRVEAQALVLGVVMGVAVATALMGIVSFVLYVPPITFNLYPETVTVYAAPGNVTAYWMTPLSRTIYWESGDAWALLWVRWRVANMGDVPMVAKLIVEQLTQGGKPLTVLNQTFGLEPGTAQATVLQFVGDGMQWSVSLQVGTRSTGWLVTNGVPP